MTIVLASQNSHKKLEISQILSNHTILLPRDEGIDFDYQETGSTFLDNALGKAMHLNELTGKPAIADDSGLCVVGLSLEPGVRSSRCAGPDATDTDRIRVLLDRMADLHGEGREAYFACVVYALLPFAMKLTLGHDMIEEWQAVPEGFRGVVAQGQLWGTICREPSGQGGFGYDPIFRPRGFGTRTLAELSLEEKNAISHRGKAFARLARAISPI